MTPATTGAAPAICEPLIHPLPPLGWEPTPFNEVVLKVATRCDLECDYCYMYTMADQDWRHQPRFMSDAVVAAAARAIGTHATRHRQDRTTVIFHGGEPLLAGAKWLARAAAVIAGQVPASTRVGFAIQTNATLLDEPALAVLADAGIRVAISFDGDSTSHDRHRRHSNGAGSHAAVVRALQRLTEPAWRPLFAGLLCVIDLTNDPAAVYESLTAFDPPVIDFLLPFGNWTRRPPGEAVDYGRWLATAFDVWYSSPPGRPEVRLFQELMALLLGGRSHSESIGLSPATMIVVAADGALEQVDSLRSAYPGAVATGLSVFTDEFDDALAHPGVRARQLSLGALGDTCRRCRLVQVCGGGHYAHRYRHGAGFANPSVYCEGLSHLISHVRQRLQQDVDRYRELSR